ncbi:ABC transporter ATP-binding protein [Sphingomonas sp.]|uniref:ABC transporter ATP-binding protein n=1 Tax=Sphingomonas sp. TaxID=28214 RepID=UPI001DDDD786|nr:ABC transporter ATP-binding protein [Sphingomonas sp.]MBX9796012.1 ABC transporter ATP-binding protein [Sphingomonas sp.]
MALTLEGVRVALGGRAVVDGVSATLAPGRVTAILGPNGAGKSTLLQAMAALVPLAGGAVRLEGAPVAEMPPRARARAIGYLPQQGVAHWNMTVADLVALGRLPHRAPMAALSAADRDAIDAALTATDTARFAARAVDRLSGGELARVLLARVLAGRPAWLLADEPLASLDPAHQLDLLDRLRALAAGGMGVVVVLHDLAQAARVADDVLLIADGALAGFGAAPDTLDEAAIARLFGIHVALTPGADGRLLPVPIARLPG